MYRARLHFRQNKKYETIIRDFWRFLFLDILSLEGQDKKDGVIHGYRKEGFLIARFRQSETQETTILAFLRACSCVSFPWEAKMKIIGSSWAIPSKVSWQAAWGKSKINNYHSSFLGGPFWDIFCPGGQDQNHRPPRGYRKERLPTTLFGQCNTWETTDLTFQGGLFWGAFPLVDQIENYWVFQGYTKETPRFRQSKKSETKILRFWRCLFWDIFPPGGQDKNDGVIQWCCKEGFLTACFRLNETWETSIQTCLGASAGMSFSWEAKMEIIGLSWAIPSKASWPAAWGKARNGKLPFQLFWGFILGYFSSGDQD